MESLQFVLLTCALGCVVLPVALCSADSAYPSPYGLEESCIADELTPVRREVYGGGRIIDISHRYHPDMPVWESPDGVGHFLWFPKSMKNGSQANNSEMKMGTHTGTHVDAPGHVIDHYLDAGFDVDTLDLEVLNGRDVILVEGLKLDDVPAGLYTVHCLPLRLVGAEGSPIRCILIK